MTLPDAPVFFAQHTSKGRGHDRLSAVAEARSKQSKAPPGLLLDFGAVHLRGVEEDKGKAGKLTPILPSGSAYEIPSKWKVPMASWVQRAAPSTKAEWNATVKESLKKQRELDVDALVVPGAELEAGDYPKGLEDQIDAIRRAWAERADDDPPWFAEFCLHDDWINLLTDLPDAIGVALRIRFAKRDAAGDASVLGKLRFVVGALADDGRKVLLIQSGIVGWLSLAWGAWGFSAGMSQESWLYHRTVIRRRSGQPSPPRVERYFERQLLHPVLSADHGRLANATGYTPCGCSFCNALAQGGAWDHNAAAQHSLYALASLTEAAAGADRTARRDAVRATIESAQNQWAQWKGTAGLSGQAAPAGLSVWRSLV
ncbi:MAG TPA: hypothetical protein VKA35_01345 [Solirubrobacterales bacterium]|nr:hypothetical protein [Solirubrobacterales bacterium]